MRDQSLSLQLLYHLSVQKQGRRRLAEAAGLTEMVVRTALDELRAAGLIQAERDGLQWTAQASARYGSLLAHVRSIGSLPLRVWGDEAETLMAHLDVSPKRAAWALRDTALAHGAEGLILLTCVCGLWRFAHNGEPLEEKNPGDVRLLRQKVPNPRDGDALVLVRASSPREAGHGLWSAIAELLEAQPI